MKKIILVTILIFFVLINRIYATNALFSDSSSFSGNTVSFSMSDKHEKHDKNKDDEDEDKDKHSDKKDEGEKKHEESDSRHEQREKDIKDTKVTPTPIQETNATPQNSTESEEVSNDSNIQTTTKVDETPTPSPIVTP